MSVSKMPEKSGRRAFLRDAGLFGAAFSGLATAQSQSGSTPRKVPPLTTTPAMISL